MLFRSKYHQRKMSDNVKVVIKLRPLIKEEKEENLSIQWIVRENSIICLNPEIRQRKDNTFHFDNIFDMDATNSDIFDTTAKTIIHATINGINGIVFSYGQFSSGKTHTMIGTLEEPGIIPLSIKYMFNVISNTIEREFLLRVSYLEIYNENINDLLNLNGINLKLYKDDNEQIIINCKEEIANSMDSMLSIMKKGLKNRRIREINRSKHVNGHSIFRITIESQQVHGDSKSVVQVSQLNLIDLVAFEGAHRVDANERQQTDISLSTLESIIMQLGKSQNDQKDIDYRNSKLTQLLYSALGGNALTAIICTLTPVALEETYHTLSFALQAKNIKNKPQKNEVVSSTSLLICYTKELAELETELQRVRNGNSSIELEKIDSLEARIRLIKNQIVSGCIANCEESFKYKSKRRQTVFQAKAGLPTIEEISPEKPYTKNIMQSVDVINQTFQTAFTDFELDLIKCETSNEMKENSNNIEKKHIDYTNSMLRVKSKDNNSCVTPEKQDSSVQTLSNSTSPSTPKNVLREYISDLTKDLVELREFTTLEKQLICEENRCNTYNLKEQLTSQCTLCNSNDNDINECSVNLILQLEEEKTKLADDLELKIQNLNEIKSDIQGFKLDVEKLQKAIYLLTNENMEISTRLSAEKKHSKEAELSLRRTIDELYARISKVTDEKINLECDLRVLNDQLEFTCPKTPEVMSDEQLLIKYQNEIDKLGTENIELATIIGEKNKELESIKESKSLLYDHECMYKDKLALFTERYEYLVVENNELSTDLIDKIEENDMLKEQCNILKNKISLTNEVNPEENDIEKLRTENNFLKAENMELKMKVTMLSDENAKFSNHLLETMEDLDSSQSNKLHLSTVPDNTKSNETPNEILQEENPQMLVNKVKTLQDNIEHLTRLNEKLSDLKLSSCSQCAYLKNVNENRKALKLETKILNHKLEDLQRKFDRKCADTEALKMKVNQDLNLTFVDGSLNASFVDRMNVNFVEEKVEHLNNELHMLKDDHDKLSILYKDGCNELEKLQEEILDIKNVDKDSKPKKNTTKNENKIKQIQKSIDQVREDIDELKKNSMNFTSILDKFKAEKTSLLDEINALKSINEELQQKVSNNEMSAVVAMEKAKILENELLNMNKEIEQFSVQEKVIKNEKLTLEIKIEDLKAEKENKDILIIGLHQMIDDLNECISSLKNELDLVMNQKNELTVSIRTIEFKYKDQLELLQKQYKELEEKNQSTEAENRATLWTKELESNLEESETNLTEQNENEKEILKQKLQAPEVRVTNSDNLIIKYKNKFEFIAKKFKEYTNESEIKLSKINETLNKYIEENNNLTQKLTKLQDIELKFNRIKEEKEHAFSEEKIVINVNEKLKEELKTIKDCMIKELISFKHEVNPANILNKSANEIFIIFLQALMSKEEEIVKTMRELFEKDKQKLEDEKRQSADAEKRMTLWTKELETEIDKLQIDLIKRECTCKEQQDKIYQLEHLLKEYSYEKEIFKEKMETLEIDYGNLQVEFDKQYKMDIRQEEAIIVAQKREKEVQEAFMNKEIELRSKIKSEKETYEKKVEDLLCIIETYKTKNMELKGNIEGLEATEKQLRNIIDANASELKMNSQTIYKMNIDLEQLTEAYNEVNCEVEQKTSRIENITSLLKNKCDMLSEYKSKLETIIPDYEILKDQVNERKACIERHKEEIEKLKMQKEKQIEIIKDKLNSEEIKNVGLSKQLNELNNKNITLMKELDTLKEKCDELQRANAKLEKKIRNSMNKMKAEAEIDDLRDQNRRLQSNLEGASNRILELQDSKHKILKELVIVKGQHELMTQENVEIKKTLSSYKTRQNIPCLLQEDGRYDALLQEKNKIALELEDKKVLLNQKDKEIKEYASRVKNLSTRNKELDNQLQERAAIINERDTKISNLKDKLKIHEAENIKLQDQFKMIKTRPSVDIKQEEDIKLHSEKVLHALRKEIVELKIKLNEYENKLELMSNSTNSRYASPTLEHNRRRYARNKVFNQKRQLENMEFEIDVNENRETCQILRKKIQELELQLVSKNGQIAALEIQIQSENFPYQQKCKELEELLLTYHKKNIELSSETRKLQRAINHINAWECDTCRRWRINRREQACQTSSYNVPQPLVIDNEVVDDHMKIMKLEKEKALMKDLCRSRCRRIKELEDKVKELEEIQNVSALRSIEPLQEKSNQQYTSSIYFNKQLNLEKNMKLVMKQNIPANLLEFKRPLNVRRKYLEQVLIEKAF